MSKALRVPDYLGHILQAIERIERYTAGMDAGAFLSSELVQDAVIRNLENLGEASNNIQRAAPEFAARHAGVPWAFMYAMRNRLSHGYAHVDLEIVWNAVQGDLPGLKTRVREVLADLRRSQDIGGEAP
ncbi:conserved hypothetical protein [Rubrivivax sp. A210]|uniref:HepT-like ribonuclease domain-containing protein n=1 Tax=Rubrivivax sp. A210 TaxID=2772301 RepID=UPI00191AF7CF|nr:DUF86 domain-containing protein [Rubrivivax sp. A210]CAD5366833.1 conserved hypothetical protein [Rubrivivax sp. A210]